MLSFFFEARYNRFDIVWIVAAAAFASHGEWVAWFSILLLGALLSVAGEAVLARRPTPAKERVG